MIASKKLKSKKSILSIFLILVFSQLHYPQTNEFMAIGNFRSWTTSWVHTDQAPSFTTNEVLLTSTNQNTIDFGSFSRSREILNSFFSSTENTLYCNTEEYVSTSSYPDANTQVYYDCKIWENQWYANPNEIPGENNVWSLVSDCTEGPGCISSFCDVSGYVPTYSYPDLNTEVYYDCKIWQNQWYANPNEIPGENNVWMYMSDCNEGNDCLLSVTENEMNAMTISPNPSSDFIEISHIEIEKDYIIYDINGQFIFDGTIGRKEKIDIRNLNSGVYFIHFKSYSIKFIKE